MVYQLPAAPLSPSRAWYTASLDEFFSSEPSAIVGRLSSNPEFDLLGTQREAWTGQIRILREALDGVRGTVLFEYSIPRMGRRIDVVLLIDHVVFVLEFKIGEDAFDRAAVDQVWDYALDLKNFHSESQAVALLPILIATGARYSPPMTLHADADGVYRPLLIRSLDLRSVIDLALSKIPRSYELNEDRWGHGLYFPTPTILEAARALYARHSVEAIARFDAGAVNLHVTSKRVEDLVEEARLTGQKCICFVTGVPGAGKTLVGLNVATRRRETHHATPAVFLSGNGPLVAVLSEALARDEVERRRAAGDHVRKGEVRESIKAFIQNVHHFRDDALLHTGPPPERIVIFDEAQRAWNLRQTASFMRRKKNQAGFSMSEPEFLISYMDRHEDWAVIVCLVGGGQEINIGEAGIDAWLEAANTRFPKWQLYISSKLDDSEYAAGKALEAIRGRHGTHMDDCLHLSVSMRSFRSENVSAFVKAMLDCDASAARERFGSLRGRYPIVVTRDLNRARRWIREHARGTERYGLVASSKAQRLKPHAIDIRVNVDPVHWFLDERDDTRSSYYLEDAATEFQVQGLELDWTCVTWDGDLRYAGLEWTYHDFRGSKWQRIWNVANRHYLRNAYRVLLTRARQGMVIFVPEGELNDPTRAPAHYDSTFSYLVGLGLPVLT